MLPTSGTSRLRAALSFLFVSLLTACGGGGGGNSPLPNPNASATPLPLTVISYNGTDIEVTGTVVGMIAGGFSMQGGSGVGYLHILTNSSTVITGGAPYVGENVDVVGTGTLSNGNITATSVKPLSTSTATPSPTATPIAVVTPPPTSAPGGPAIPVPANVLQQTAQITSVSGTHLTVNAGAGCGSMYVYLNSGTTYFNGTPQVNQYGVFTGTGARCSSITANTVSLSSSPETSATFTGTVTAQTSYGFTLSTSGSTVPVAMSKSTVVFGSALVVGSNVTVTALGTTATGLTATQIAVAAPATPTPDPASTPTPTPGPISQTHVLTFAYMYGYAGTPASVSIGSVQPYINWTQTDQAHAAALRAAGVKVQVYTNFWRNYSSDNPIIGYTDLKPGGTNAAAEAKDCSGNPVYDPMYGGGYEADPRTSNALTHAQTVVNYRVNSYAGNYDAVFADDTGAVTGISLPCGYVQSTYDNAVNNIHSQLGMAMWINALGSAPNPATATDLVAASNVQGAMCEMCYAGDGSGADSIQTGNNWMNVENAEIGTVSQRKVFWDYARLAGDASSETSMRVYAYASFLLSYDPSYAMFQEALSTPSGFPVMPETGFVPMNPLTTAASVSGYQNPGGAYFREFSSCYYRGAFVSNCAVVVNPNASSVPVPSTSYSHSLTLSGYGVLDGGSVGFNGGSVTTLAPGTAAILLP